MIPTKLVVVDLLGLIVILACLFQRRDRHDHLPWSWRSTSLTTARLQTRNFWLYNSPTFVACLSQHECLLFFGWEVGWVQILQFTQCWEIQQWLGHRLPQWEVQWVSIFHSNNSHTSCSMFFNERVWSCRWITLHWTWTQRINRSYLQYCWSLLW